MSAGAVRADARGASDVETIVTVRMPIDLRQQLAQEIRHRLRSGLHEERADV
jgi:hypothetical protein